MQGLGLGIGLEILSCIVSESESGLENRDSGNSAALLAPILPSSYGGGKEQVGSSHFDDKLSF